jgi:hypothetical protein
MMDSDIYNNQYLKDTIASLKDQVADLHTWSVYNDDKLSDELAEIDELVKKL